MNKRKAYSPQFKQETLALVNSRTEPASQMARDLVFYPPCYNRWRREHKQSGSAAFTGSGTHETNSWPKNAYLKNEGARDAAAESFFALLKRERVYRNTTKSEQQVRADMFAYIECFHNLRHQRKLTLR